MNPMNNREKKKYYHKEPLIEGLKTSDNLEAENLWSKVVVLLVRRSRKHLGADEDLVVKEVEEE